MEKMVQMISLTQLVQNFGITELDYLKIDAEGHDVVILEGYDWKVKPKFLKCEHGRNNDLMQMTVRHRDRDINTGSSSGIYTQYGCRIDRITFTVFMCPPVFEDLHVLLA